MRSPKSKHQGRYQWSEVQTFARELAEHKSEHRDGNGTPNHGTTFISRIAREESLREERAAKDPRDETQAHKNLTYPRGREIDLDSFRSAWSKSRAPLKVERESRKDEMSSTGSRRDLESGASLNEQKNSHIDDPRCQSCTEEMELSDESPITNPWEQLRDHFIGLREQRLSQEASAKTSLEVSKGQD